MSLPKKIFFLFLAVIGTSISYALVANFFPQRSFIWDIVFSIIIMAAIALIFFLILLLLWKIIIAVKSQKSDYSITFTHFLKQFFINYQDFFKIYVALKKPPFLLFTVWLVGMSGVVSQIGLRHWKYTGPLPGTDNWLGIWLIILSSGFLGGLLAYLVGGLFYHLRVWICGGQKNLQTSSHLYIYTSLPICLVVLSWQVFNVIAYDQEFFIRSTNGQLNRIWVGALIIAVCYSVFISYKGAILLHGTKKIRSIIFFLILPIAFYCFTL